MTPPASTVGNGHGYIYILKGWDRLYVHKHGPRSRPPWPFVKNETALLDDPDYLELSCQERAWLHGIWMLAGKHGQGRVSASGRYLKGQLGVRKGSLDPLIHAGWIEVRASKAQALSKAKQEEEILLSNLDSPPSPITEVENRDLWGGSPVARLRAICDEGATDRSEETWRKIVATRGLSQYDVERVREKAMRQRASVRARYITKTLKVIEREEAA